MKSRHDNGSNSRKKQAGFTLLEALLYIALSSVLLTGLIVSAVSLIDSGAWFSARTDALLEGHFVIQKFDWLVRNNADFQLFSEHDRVWLEMEGGMGAMPHALTSRRVAVESFSFIQQVEDGVPDVFEVGFLIAGISFHKKIWKK